MLIGWSRLEMILERLSTPLDLTIITIITFPLYVGPGWPASFFRAEHIRLHFFWDGTDRPALFSKVEQLGLHSFCRSEQIGLHSFLEMEQISLHSFTKKEQIGLHSF